MKYSKRYIWFTVILLIAMILKFYRAGAVYEQVETFRGATIEKEVWNPLIADSVNENTLSLVVDNRKYSNEDSGIYMNDDLEIMIPVSMIRDGFNCSSNLYDEEELLVEKHESSVTFSAIDKELKKHKEEYYVSVSELSDALAYDYTWDIEKNVATATDVSGATSIYPSKYDLREKKRNTPVKNQGSLGTCWASASVGALETSLLPEESLQFSVDHMTMRNSFRLTQNDGGEYTMGMAYLTAWQGPVYEADDPYGDGVSPKGLEAVKHVQEIQVIEGKDFEKIKEAIFKYGGVQTSIYSALRSSQSTSSFYNSANNAYCYIGTEKPNHDVMIIGWDDNYSKDNFSVKPEGDGAFICQNSWGTGFGDEGIFYISYYDTNIGVHNVVYTGIEETDNYDSIYQSDLCGWVGQLGFNKESIYGANVFEAEKAQKLKAAGFYATGKDTEYEVYVVRNFTDESSFERKEKVASGKLDNAGYYTIPFSKNIPVKEGERFSIVVYLKTPDAVHPMAIEYKADATTAKVDLSDGEGYISTNGSVWENVEDTQECNLCIKAYAGK
ncbi:MAG: lectin like domain-containing protein [Lachnospiraceae bacterium]|nr:lectin like domain-containing protein [Lachnospiraceae bacterium]MDD7378758.1 lectin like domain-containing protein [Lachnospiraceae bacterium]MDY4617542.1 lectin like domain-containing protein [Lachnospiraceae bacterium]